MRTLTLTAVVAATLFPSVAAHAETSARQGWRAAACSNGGYVEDAPTGASRLVASSRVAVDDLPGVLVGVDRLDFSGVSCEILYVDGRLPRGASVTVARATWCAGFSYAVDGVHEDVSTSCTASAGKDRLYSEGWPDVPTDVQVLTVETVRGHESEVLDDEPGLPPQYVGATLTTDHLGSEWSAVLTGTVQERREFDRSRATDRAARAAYVREVARVTRAFDERKARIVAKNRSRNWKTWKIEEARAEWKQAVADARWVQRLALQGVQLVQQDFRAEPTGTLPPVA